MITGCLFPMKILGGENMSDEQEQRNTASQEIEIARRRIAACVNSNLEGVNTTEMLETYAAIIARIR